MRAVSLTLIALFWCTPAFSQQICGLIAEYFIDAPSGFIAERGEQLDEGSWKSRQNHQNASCTIYFDDYDDESSHRISCIYNKDGTPERVTSFYKNVEEDIKACVSKLPNSDEYESEVYETSRDGRTRVRTEWSSVQGSVTYLILVGAARLADGRLYNFIGIEFETRN